MKAQREKILNELSSYGWNAVQLEDYELEWWTDEIWMLESTWSPKRAKAYVSFLVDPMIQHSKTRKKGESVWAVMASPFNKSKEDSFEISLNQGWEKRLPDFIEHLDKIRNRQEN